MELNVLYSSSSTYIELTLLSMYTLIENNKHNKICIYFVCDELNDDEKNKIINSLCNFNNVSVKLYDLYEFCDYLPDLNFVNYRKSIFIKFFIDKIDKDKVLYLDSDTIILGKLDDLFADDMKENIIGGVQINPPNHYKKYFSKTMNDQYINGGVIIFNNQNWKKNNISEKIYSLIKNVEVEFIEENILCAVCQGKIKYISPRYNLMSSVLFFKSKKFEKIYNLSYSVDEINESMVTPKIVHYLNEFYIRPWFIKSNHPMKGIFDSYNEKYGNLIEYNHIKIKKNFKFICLKVLPTSIISFILRRK